jgi:hypothetical protein
MIPYKKESPIKKTELGNVKIGGYAAELMENFFYERIFSKKAKNVSKNRKTASKKEAVFS